MELKWDDCYYTQNGASWKSMVSCGAACIATLLHAKTGKTQDVCSIRNSVDAKLAKIQHVWNYQTLASALNDHDIESRLVDLQSVLATHRKGHVYLALYKPKGIREDRRPNISQIVSNWRRTCLVTSIDLVNDTCRISEPLESGGRDGRGLIYPYKELSRAVKQAECSQLLRVYTFNW